MEITSRTAALDDAEGARVTRGRPAASWGAIIAGASVALASTFILVSLGFGLELASVSPWPARGATITTFSVTTAIWLIVTQWISAALGGYITGRLRSRWIGTHAHEVFFRDTAHGLVTWSVATVVFVGVMAGSVTEVAGGAARAASTTTAADAYGIDRLFRSAGQAGVGSAATATVSPNEQARSEAAHIVSQSVATGSLIDTDRTYLTSLIVQQTGASAGDARQRVDELVQNLNDAKSRLEQAADSARKAGAETAIYTALSMLIGAFIASVSAAFAGRLRDEHP
jgi:hypothetical protein